MRNAWLALPPALLTACGLTVLGGAPPDDDVTERGDERSPAADGAPVDDVVVGSEGATDSNPPEDATFVLDGPCEPSLCPGRRCNGDACATFVSCKDLHDNGPAGVGSGIYPVGAPGAIYTAYCEMVLAGGGWTLVGQSGPGAVAGFGWKSETGSVTDPNGVYSMNAVGHGVAMTQALLATGRRNAIDAAYVVTLPGGFPTGFENKSGGTSATKITNAACPTNVATPTMMNNAGYTSQTDRFYFRDVGGSFATGLVPTRWNLYYADSCVAAGKYTDRPGMIFVR